MGQIQKFNTENENLNQQFPDSKMLKGLQILLSGESWRVDLGSRAAAGTAAAATADSAHCCSWCGSPHSAQLLSAEELPKIFGLFAVGLVCTIPTLCTGIFRYVPCLGCLVQLVLTAYLKTWPSMQWPMILRQYNGTQKDVIGGHP